MAHRHNHYDIIIVIIIIIIIIIITTTTITAMILMINDELRSETETLTCGAAGVGYSGQIVWCRQLSTQHKTCNHTV